MRSRGDALVRPEASALEVERVEAHLAQCEDLDEVKQIRDQSKALLAYQQTRKVSKRGRQRFERIAFRAEIRLGELLDAVVGHEGGKPSNRNTVLRLEDHGIGRMESSRWQRAAALPEDIREEYLARMCDEDARPVTSALAELSGLPERDQRRIVSRATTPREVATEARRAKRMAKLGTIERGNRPIPIERGPWPVLYGDPPWRYEHVKTESRAIENHYPTMTLDEICDPKMGGLATDDAILFLWATSPKLAEAMRVLDAWRFVYRTNAVWDKGQIGMGYYFRQQHELLLVATRGQPPAPAPSERMPSVIRAPRGRHSAKPAVFAETIERMYPSAARVELWCRGAPRAGWDAWGNEAVAEAAE